MYKLYRHDYSGGVGLGGADYPPGTEWYMVDKNDKVAFWREDGEIANLYYRHEGYDQFVHRDWKFIRNVSADEGFLIRNKVRKGDIPCKCGHGKNIIKMVDVK